MRPRRAAPAGLVAVLVAACAAAPAMARAGDLAGPAAADAGPMIGIIIDDLGNRRREGIDAIDLPGPIAYSFLPRTPHAAALANLARRRGKDVMLHLPMESLDGRPLGPVRLERTMTADVVRAALEKGLASVPHVIGVNNHMGSLLTSRPGPMRLLMDAMARHRGLFFVDSRTTSHSVASAAAIAAGVPSLERDVFLDHDTDPAAVRRQFLELVDKARKLGAALGIGHPHRATTATLAGLLPTLERRGIRLVPVTTLVARKHRRFTARRPGTAGDGSRTSDLRGLAATPRGADRSPARPVPTSSAGPPPPGG